MRLQDVPMQRKLVGSFLLVGCVPAILLTLVSLIVAIFSLSSSTYEQLTGLRQAKQRQLDNYFSEQRNDLQVLSKTVESFQQAADEKLSAIMEAKKVTLLDYLNSVRSQLLDFAKRPKIIEAMWDLPQYFPSYVVENRWNEEDLRQRREKLQSYWEEEFGERYRQLNDGKDPEIEKYFSQLDDYTIALQHSYIANNPNPMGFKDELDKPDETAYSRLHEQLHPSIRSFLREFGYYDIFLVETEEGRVVYYTFKELNFGT